MGEVLRVASRVYDEIDGPRTSRRPANDGRYRRHELRQQPRDAGQRRTSQPMREHYCGDGVPEASSGGTGASPSSDASSSAGRVRLHSGTTTNLRHSHQT